MTTPKMQTVVIEISEHTLAQLRAHTMPEYARATPAQVIVQALLDYQRRCQEMTVSQELLRELSARAGMKPIIDSPQTLVKAFEAVTTLDKNSAIIHLEEPVAIQLGMLAKNLGITLGEELAQLYTKAVSLSWIMTMDDKRYVMFNRQEWERLQVETGRRQPGGSDLVQEIIRRVKPTSAEVVALPEEAAAASPKGMTLAELVAHGT